MGKFDRIGAEGTGEIFLARIQDMVNVCTQKCVPKFTAFLDESQVFAASRYLEKNAVCGCCFWGGYPGAKRQMLGVFPEYMEPSGEHFPIAAFTITYRAVDKLSHRDFLGSLMALQIKREAVGDILVSDGICSLFTTDKVAPLVLSEIQKIGRTGVKIEQGLTAQPVAEEKFLDISGTVASMRLDCVVSLLMGKSREKTNELIKGGIVSVNYQICENNSMSVSTGDIITVKGFGKARVSEEIRKTKKDRYFIVLQKYI